MIIVVIDKKGGIARYAQASNLVGILAGMSGSQVYFFRDSPTGDNIFAKDLSAGPAAGPAAGPYPDLEWDNSPTMRSTIYNYWAALLNKDASSFIAANALWWATPGANWRQNIFTAGQYSRDAILEENPLSQDLIKLNSLVITYDSQDTSRCEDNFMHPREGLIDIIAIPYVNFYMTKEVSAKLLGKKDAIPDCLVISIDGKVVFNDALIKRLQYGPYLEQEYSVPAGTIKLRDKFVRKKELNANDYDADRWGISKEHNIWWINKYGKEYALFKSLVKNLDSAHIISSREPCDPTDNLYQRLIEYIS